MRIREIKATPVNIPFRAPYRARRWRSGKASTASYTKTIVEVRTDEGLIGLGEAADGDRAATIERLGERLVGLDPLDLNECEARCLPGDAYHLQLNLLDLRRAFGAIEMALWDLRGKAEGRPLYALLGGAVRRHIPFTEYFSYRLASAEGPGEWTPLEVARYCARMVEEYESPSFEGKVAIFPLAREVEMVREVRRAIGEDRELRLDANGGWTLATAREAVTKLAPYQVQVLEEPVRTFEELARLRPHTPIAFSAHEPDLRRAVHLGVPDYFVQTIPELGGIRRTVEFVAACELLGFGFWFYSGDTGVASAAYLHLAAALEPLRRPSQALFRWMADDVIAEGPFSPYRGTVAVPDGPGLGVTLDRKALERCHQRYRDEGAFPSADAQLPAEQLGPVAPL
jgi:glucarate dehydratase